MKPTDRLLQRWRIAMAARYIPMGARVLDIGCSDGTLFRQLGHRIRAGIGIDPVLGRPVSASHVDFIAGRFPHDLPTTEPFDVITMLATLEHFPAAAANSLAGDCARRLLPGGKVIVTVPAPCVDHILRLLRAARLIDGMAVDEHHGFDPSTTPALFAAGPFSLDHRGTFQLGLNNLFVFAYRPGSQEHAGPVGLVPGMAANRP